MRGLGLALIVASSVALIRPVQLAASMYVGPVDPRDPLGTKLGPIEVIRALIGLGVCAAGVWQLRRSLLRARSERQSLTA